LDMPVACESSAYSSDFVMDFGDVFFSLSAMVELSPE
jgi:hypothetical protein